MFMKPQRSIFFPHYKCYNPPSCIIYFIYFIFTVKLGVIYEMVLLGFFPPSFLFASK